MKYDIDLKNYVGVLNKVCVFAENRYNEYIKERESQALLNFENNDYVIDLSDVTRKKCDTFFFENLFKYLVSLDMVSFMVVANIMYIGRDCAVNKSNDFDANKFFNDWLNSEQFVGVSEWKDINKEVEHIYSKLPLHIYLKRGMDFLELG